MAAVTQDHLRQLLLEGHLSSCMNGKGQSWEHVAPGIIQSHPTLLGQPTHLSFVPRVATKAGAAVVTAMIGPGGTVVATEEETTMVAVGGPALLGAVVATAELMITSGDEGQAGANTVLSVHSALCGR